MPATRSTTLLPGLLDRLADYRRLRQAVTQGKSPLALSGLAAVHRTHFAAALLVVEGIDAHAHVDIQG